MSTGPLRGRRLGGSNLQTAGDHNQRVVLHCIRVNPAATKSDIARITGLTHPAVTNICNRLMLDGLIVTAGQRRGERGQPATKLEIRPEGAWSVGLNIDRDHVTMVLVDFIGALRARRSMEMPFPLPGQVKAWVAKQLPELAAEAGIDPASLTGAGVAMPDQLGDIDLPGRTPEFASWSDIDVADLFPPGFERPVVAENDAAAAAVGEMHFGLGKRHANFFYLLITYGLGGGLVVDGLYRRGASGRSGEIGLLPAASGGEVQSIVSLSGLYRELAEASQTLPAPDEAGFATLDPAGEAAVDRWIDEAAHTLLSPLVAVGFLIDPEAILIGGRLPPAIVDRLVQAITTRLANAHIPRLPLVQRAALASDASAMGAAILPFADMLMPSDQSQLPRTAGTGPAG